MQEFIRFGSKSSIPTVSSSFAYDWLNLFGSRCLRRQSDWLQELVCETILQFMAYRILLSGSRNLSCICLHDHGNIYKIFLFAEHCFFKLKHLIFPFSDCKLSSSRWRFGLPFKAGAICWSEIRNYVCKLLTSGIDIPLKGKFSFCL